MCKWWLLLSKACSAVLSVVADLLSFTSWMSSMSVTQMAGSSHSSKLFSAGALVVELPLFTASTWKWLGMYTTTCFCVVSLEL